MPKTRVFLAMDDEAKAAFYRRDFRTVWVPGLLMTVQRKVEAGELPAVFIKKGLVGVACDVNLLFELVEETRVRQKQGRVAKKKRNNEEIRQLVLSQTAA